VQLLQGGGRAGQHDVVGAQHLGDEGRPGRGGGGNEGEGKELRGWEGVCRVCVCRVASCRACSAQGGDASAWWKPSARRSGAATATTLPSPLTFGVSTTAANAPAANVHLSAARAMAA
jgi:hypothetical protein